MIGRRAFLTVGTTASGVALTACGGGGSGETQVAAVASDRKSVQSITTNHAVYDVSKPPYSVSTTGGNSSNPSALAANAASIQQAFDDARDDGGGTVYFPRGIYEWNSRIDVHDNTSMFGDGRGTELRPIGCDGFYFPQSGVIGSRKFSDFYMQGQSGYTGIAVLSGTTSTSLKVTGILFSNVSVHNFAVGFDCFNLWHSTFNHVVVYECPIGISFSCRSVGNSIVSSKIQNGTIPGTYGIKAVLANGASPEDVRIMATLVYGFDTNVFIDHCLNFAIIGSDVDASGTRGIHCVTVDGGCSIIDNWVAGTSSTTGITVDSLGTASSSPVTIEGNNVLAGTGVFIGYNRTGLISIRSNNIGNSGTNIAVYISGTKSVIVEGNYLQGTYALYTDFGSEKNRFVRNQLVGSLFRSTGVLDYFEYNNGTLPTCYHGPVTIPAFATTLNTNLAGLGVSSTQNFPSNIIVRVNAYEYTGTFNRGHVRGFSDWVSSLTVEVTNMASANSGDIWVDLEIC